MDTDALAVVWNPAKVDREALEEALRVDEVTGELTWFETSEADPGQGAAGAALEAGARALVVAGGDGTVRAVIEALAGTDVPLGIVPSGTGNLLARNLGIPIGDLESACRVARDGALRRIDVGWASIESGRHAFAVIAGFGLDSRMIAETDEDLKSKTGWLAYVASLGKALASADVVDIAMSVDGNAPSSIRAHTVMVGNCGTVQAGMTLLPDAAPDDGALDALVLSADSLGGWLDTLKTSVWDNGVMRWFQAEPEAVSSASTDHLRGERFELTMHKPVTFEVDGDELGDVASVIFEIDPAAVSVRVPRG